MTQTEIEVGMLVFDSSARRGRVMEIDDGIARVRYSDGKKYRFRLCAVSSLKPVGAR